MDFPARVIAECTNSYGINESLFIYLFNFSSFSLDAAESQSLVAAQVVVGNVQAFSKTAGSTPKSEVYVLNMRAV